VNVRHLSPLVGILILPACMVATTTPAGSGVYGPPPAGGMNASGAIEAGCSYNGTNLPGDIGAVFQVSCPPGCESMGGGLWGSDVYTADSVICRAGIHAGAISPAGGVVSVRLEPGRPAYRGSFRNGTQSSDYGNYGKSYAVLGPGAPVAGAYPPAGGYPPPEPAYQPTPTPPPPPQPPIYQTQPAQPAYPPPQPPQPAYPQPAAQVVEAGCSFNATQLRGAPGSSFLVACPPGCLATGSVWGTDRYTGDSGICKAGIHVGLISDEGGGRVWVTIEPGQPAYRGSHRNRVRSNDYGSYPSSFHLSPAR